jgi:hypothetical protein
MQVLEVFHALGVPLVEPGRRVSVHRGSLRARYRLKIADRDRRKLDESDVDFSYLLTD